MKPLEITNKRFGRLVAIKYHHSNKLGHRYWLCKCDCGKEVIVGVGNLGRHTNSCGCLAKELSRERQKKHLSSKTRLYPIWSSMKRRCYSKTSNSYKNYGARGIKMCDEWLGEHGFEHFKEWALANGYKEETLPNNLNKWTIDRVDNDGDYEPSNCRWITAEEQQKNTRNNRFITFNNKTQILADWSREIGINIDKLYHRLKSGWSIEKALTTPLQGVKNVKE